MKVEDDQDLVTAWALSEAGYFLLLVESEAAAKGKTADALLAEEQLCNFSANIASQIESTVLQPPCSIRPVHVRCHERAAPGALARHRGGGRRVRRRVVGDSRPPLCRLRNRLLLLFLLLSSSTTSSGRAASPAESQPAAGAGAAASSPAAAGWRSRCSTTRSATAGPAAARLDLEHVRSISAL